MKLLCIIQSLLTGALISLTSCAADPDGQTVTRHPDGTTITVTPPPTIEGALTEMCKRPLQ